MPTPGCPLVHFSPFAAAKKGTRGLGRALITLLWKTLCSAAVISCPPTTLVFVLLAQPDEPGS